MNRVILILAVILITVWAALSILGADAEYAAEKLFYQTMKINSKIAANPDVVLPNLVATVENGLQKLLKDYPKTNTARRAHITLAEFYAVNKKYTKALSVIDNVMSTYNKDPVILSMARFLKGTIYEKQDEWDKALVEFAILKEKHHNTQLGMEIPLYIAKHYEMKGSQAQAEKAYNGAAGFYKKLKSENEGKMLGYAASALLLQSYLSLKNYEEAGATLEGIINIYPSPLTYRQFLPFVELIYMEKLNRPAKAIEIYKNIQQKTKDAKLIKFLKQRIEILEVGK